MLFVDAQKAVFHIVRSNDVLIGHELSSDLHSLRIVHDRVVGTAFLFRHSKKLKLKNLCQMLLYRNKEHPEGHGSVDDDMVVIDLVECYCNNLDEICLKGLLPDPAVSAHTTLGLP